MPDAIRAYSIALAPLSLWRNRRNDLNRLILVSLRHYNSAIKCDTNGTSAGGIG
jgi:hypothetical protein